MLRMSIRGTRTTGLGVLGIGPEAGLAGTILGEPMSRAILYSAAAAALGLP